MAGGAWWESDGGRGQDTKNNPLDNFFNLTKIQNLITKDNEVRTEDSFVEQMSNLEVET